MAREYYKYLIVNRIRRKLPKRWVQQDAFTIQRLMDRAGIDEGRFIAVINYALAAPKYRGKARKGPHELRRVWRDLLADYDAGQKPAAPAVSDNSALENEHEREVNEVASVE